MSSIPRCPTLKPGSLIPFAPDHLGTEQALAKSGVPHTILRVSWYVENLLRSLPSVFATGKWYSAAGEGRVANIARDDVARGRRSGARQDTGRASSTSPAPIC